MKLTEAKFTHCNGRESRGNRRRDVCQSAQLFFGNPGNCYLTRPYRKSRDRRYWEIFTAGYGGVRQAFPNVDLSGGCPFAYDMQQPMRNLAIARAPEQEDVVQKAWYGLCVHDQNPDVTGHWSAWQDLLGQTTPAPLIPVSKVVRAGEETALPNGQSTCAAAAGSRELSCPFQHQLTTELPPWHCRNCFHRVDSFRPWSGWLTEKSTLIVTMSISGTVTSSTFIAGLPGCSRRDWSPELK